MPQVVELLVIDLTGDKLHAVLGHSWLLEHSAHFLRNVVVVRYYNGGEVL